MNNVEVSVIIPTYQRRNYVAAAIESVQRQIYGEFEIWIIDDGSTDGTAQLIHEISNKDARVHYHYQSNAGPASARNKGITLASGKFLAFLDSDDLWMPDKLKMEMEIFSEDPQIGMIYCNGIFIGPDGRKDEAHSALIRCTKLYNAEDLLFDPNSRFNTSGVIVRKSCLQQAGEFDETLKFFEDIDLWFRVLLHCKARFLNQDMVINRLHDTNLVKTSVNVERESAESTFRWRQKAVRSFEERVRPLSHREKSEVLYRYQLMIIKESLAAGRNGAARREAVRYVKERPFSPAGWICLLLSLAPAKMTAAVIQKRRTKLREGVRKLT